MQADEVAAALFDIFTTIGAPLMLQTDNGKEFEAFKRGKPVGFSEDEMDAIVKKVFELWPECVCVRGRPRHSQSNGRFPFTPSTNDTCENLTEIRFRVYEGPRPWLSPWPPCDDPRASARGRNLLSATTTVKTVHTKLIFLDA